ncbi:MAG: solute:Na+ symporter, family [Candidatus Sumerlaeota bacterium]|nr:solute:Na+ symporter, family [Candidatus Sumerlaeota bacterium]
MQLSAIDWVVIGAYFVVALGVGLYFRKRAGKNLAEFFISGRSLPWWIAGTSMVATTFAADTPLAVVGLTADHGLAGNWFWWSMAMGGMVTVFVYSRLWRRAEVMTDQEVVEMRYGGKPASFLRGFRAVYFALPINCIIVGWVTSALVTVMNETILYKGPGTEPSMTMNWLIIVGCLAIVGVYSVLSGMWGVAVTDVIQFVLAMGGCIALAVLAVNDAGGMAQLRTNVAAAMPDGQDAFRFLPDFSTADPLMPLQMFLVYLFILWWASWYPGAEPGGGGYVVQRMASCKDEKHSLLATLWFQVAHYCVRPWPWLLVAFAAIAKYPDLLTLENKGVGFPRIMRDLLPSGLRGLLLVAFLAAFMSTLSTQINWGASYLVSDVYKRFMRPDATDRQLAVASRWASLLVLLAGGASAFVMVYKDVSVDTAWKLLAALGAGTGAVYMLRWFWWRINAWAELSAMAASLVYYALFAFVIAEDMPNQYRLAIVAGLTIATWVVVMLVTPHEKEETLVRFFEKVRPGGPGWGPLAAKCPHVVRDKQLGLSLVCAGLGATLVYLTLPGVGLLLFGEWLKGLACLGGAAICAGGIVVLLNRTGWEKLVR